MVRRTFDTWYMWPTAMDQAIASLVRFQNEIWLLSHGAINLLLGIMTWQQWPLSGHWVIGLIAGIDLMLNGWSLIMLGLAVKKLHLQ